MSEAVPVIGSCPPGSAVTLQRYWERERPLEGKNNSTAKEMNLCVISNAVTLEDTWTRRKPTCVFAHNYKGVLILSTCHFNPLFSWIDNFNQLFKDFNQLFKD